MKKWNKDTSDFLDALGGNTSNPLDNVHLSEDAGRDQMPVKSAKLVGKSAKKSSSAYQITSMHVEAGVYKKFKKFAVVKERTITDLLTSAMKDMLEGRYMPAVYDEK